MKIVIPERFDHVFNAPPGWKPTERGECAGLPVRKIALGDGHVAFRSFWKPTPEELALLKLGGAVALDVVTAAAGGGHPVVRLGAELVDEVKIPKEMFGG